MSSRSTARLAVLVSGSGTNLQAIIDAIAAGNITASLAGVLSDRPEAHGLARARAAGIPAVGIDFRAYTDRADYDAQLDKELARLEPDLVILDVMLPHRSGYDICRDLRSAKNAVPILMLTAKGQEADTVIGLELGADDYITKPFREHEILDAIAATTHRQHQLRQRVADLLADRRSERGANWSHELMTPLNGIFGALQLIEEEPSIPAAELAEMLGIIRSSAQHQYNLARRLVLHFDLESQAVKHTPRGHCDATNTARAAALRVSSSHHRSEDVRIEVAPGSIAGSDYYLADVLAELIENAFKFSRTGQPVAVRGNITADNYVFEIQDEGPGFTADELSQLRPFTQFLRPGLVKKGLGLGLAIARSFARVAGGRLDVLPRDPGPGAIVRLTLPLAPADQSTDQN